MHRDTNQASATAELEEDEVEEEAAAGHVVAEVRVSIRVVHLPPQSFQCQHADATRVWFTGRGAGATYDKNGARAQKGSRSHSIQ